MEFKPDFLVTPYALYEDKTLVDSDRNIYAVVYWFERMKDGVCKASNATIAKYAMVHESTVANSLNRLEKQGYIYRTFSDEAKRNRESICCNLRFEVRSVSPTGETIKGVVVSPTGEQISNILSNTIVLDKRKRKKKAEDTNDPMTLSEFVAYCKGSPNRMFHIIANYADEKKFAYTTKGQWRSLIQRNLRPAKLLAPYTDEQISKAWLKLEKDIKREFITKWTLETVIKYLD